MSDSPTLSVVVPVFNSSDTLPELHRQLVEILSCLPSVEIIYVDDASASPTKLVLDTLKAQGANVITFLENKGQQEATLCGLSQAKGLYIANMDDDLQHPVSLMPELLSTLQKNRLDIVYGVPETICDGPRRRWGARLRDVLFSALFHKDKGVQVSAYRVMTRDLAERVLSQRTGFNYFSAMVFSQPTKAASLFYPYQKRKQGRSGYTLSKQITLFCNIWRYYGPLKQFYKKFEPPVWPEG